MTVEVTETGEIYHPGTFVANLMYQGVYHEDTANYTGTVQVLALLIKLVRSIGVFTEHRAQFSR